MVPPDLGADILPTELPRPVKSISDNRELINVQLYTVPVEENFKL